MEQVKTVAGTALLGLIALSGLLCKAVLGILAFLISSDGNPAGGESDPQGFDSLLVDPDNDYVSWAEMNRGEEFDTSPYMDMYKGS